MRRFCTLVLSLSLLSCVCVPCYALAQTALEQKQKEYTYSVGSFTLESLSLDALLKSYPIRIRLGRDIPTLDDFQELLTSASSAALAVLDTNAQFVRQNFSQLSGSAADEQWAEYQAIYASSTSTIESSYNALGALIDLAFDDNVLDDEEQESLAETSQKLRELVYSCLL